MKTIYVKVYSAQEAEEYAKSLYKILRNCTPVIGELGKIMADMKPYKEIKDGKELVDFIIKEEESGK